MALCVECKNQIEIKDSFCRNCGRKLSKTPVSSVKPDQETKQETSFLAVLALVMVFVVPIIGFILSFFALAQFKKNPNLKGEGFAWAAFLIPLIAILILSAILILGVLKG